MSLSPATKNLLELIASKLILVLDDQGLPNSAYVVDEALAAWRSEQSRTGGADPLELLSPGGTD